jgi:hypothetical protein
MLLAVPQRRETCPHAIGMCLSRGTQRTDGVHTRGQCVHLWRHKHRGETEQKRKRME